MKSARPRSDSARRFILGVLVCLSFSLPLVAPAAADPPEDRYGAAIDPTSVQPLTSRAYTITITNRNNSTDAANNAHVSVPVGFVPDGATLSATTTASGSCSAAAWTVTLNAAGTTIDAVAPAAAASQLCPGGTLRITVTASAPAPEQSYMWTTALLHDSTAFSIQGAQPSVAVDATAPQPPAISSGPPNPSNSSGPSFAFSDADATATFRCQLDGGAFSACTSPKTYAGVAEGPHTFAVKAVDPAGNESPATPYAWTIDFTPPPSPTVTSAPPNVTASTSAAFSFSDTEATVSYLCNLGGGTFSACTSPASYPGPLTAGLHTFAVKARDAAGNESSATSYSWTIDLTNPVVTIDPATEPPNPTNATSASFAFTSNKAGSTFACQLDGAGFSACASPKGYPGLGNGRHGFTVKATDSLGNTGPATIWEWTVDTIAPPAPSIGSAPRNPTNLRAATFGFSGGEPGLGFACRLGSGGFAPCTSPVTYAGLTDGAHVFAVRATDAAGNTGPIAARTWVVDTLPPRTTITSKPGAESSSASASFEFTSSKGSSSFACSLDGSAFAACSTPRTYGGLADGTHAFQVRAADPAGNTDPAPPSYSWHVAVPPGTVRGLKRSVGYRLLKLGWSLPRDADFDHVQVLRSRERNGGPQTVVYDGKGRSYVDSRFQNGTFYRYQIRSYDRAGNASRPVPVVVPPGVLLRSPRDGGVAHVPPLLLWSGVSRATYYNVQVYLGAQKVLSAWPNRARLRMGRRWVYQDHRFHLRKGTYRWWVWPGFGPRSKGAYGRLLGTATFVVR